jgi:hypothetical protein
MIMLCPNCKSILTGDDIMRGVCPSCKKLFDRPLVIGSVVSEDRKINSSAGKEVGNISKNEINRGIAETRNELSPMERFGQEATIRIVGGTIDGAIETGKFVYDVAIAFIVMYIFLGLMCLIFDHPWILLVMIGVVGIMLFICWLVDKIEREKKKREEMEKQWRG